jgi:hypothetical protein
MQEERLVRRAFICAHVSFCHFEVKEKKNGSLETSEICECCNNHNGVGKKNYPSQVDTLSGTNFQTNLYTCTSILDKCGQQQPHL